VFHFALFLHSFRTRTDVCFDMHNYPRGFNLLHLTSQRSLKAPRHIRSMEEINRPMKKANKLVTFSYISLVSFCFVLMIWDGNWENVNIICS
jgi:hypothetical protein